MRSKQSGVTLVELITVVVIVAILSAIAIPSYRSFTIRANRTDAKTALSTVAANLERCYTRFNSYMNPPCAIVSPINSDNLTYVVTIGNRAAGTFTLTATPQGAQAADTDCGNFTLNELGVKGKSGSKSVAACWGK